MADQREFLPAGPLIALVDSVDLRYIAYGVAWLVAGIMVYALARPPGVAFLPQSFSLYAYFPNQLTALAGPLPVFFHVGAMSYLTIGLLALSRRGALVACVTWAALDVLFEIGQHDRIATWLNSQIPTWFDDTPILKLTRGFFFSGTFDVLDVVAAVLAAVLVFQLTNHVSPTRNSS